MTKAHQIKMMTDEYAETLLNDMYISLCETGEIKRPTRNKWYEYVVSILKGKEALSNHRWVLISERLPDHDGKFIVTTDNGATKQSHFYISISHRGFTDSEKNHIIAWMEFPKPYKKG